MEIFTSKDINARLGSGEQRPLGFLMQVRPQIKNNAFWFSLLFSSCLLVYTLFFAAVRYQTNDDVAMLLYTHIKSDPHLLFSNYYYGKLLVWLTSHFEGFVWYSAFQLGSLFISLSIVWYVVLKRLSNVIAFFLCFFLALCSGIPALQDLQFTVVSSYCTIAFFLLFLYLLEGNGNRFWILKWVVCLFVGSIGFVIRFESFVMIGLFVPFLFLFHYRLIKFNSPNVVMLSVSVLVFLGLLFLRYSSEHVDSYYAEYRKNIIQFLDYNSLEKFPPDQKSLMLKEAGFSPNDYRLFKSWSFQDKDIFSVDKLRRLNELASDKKISLEINYLESFYHLLLGIDTKDILLSFLILAFSLLRVKPFLRVMGYLACAFAILFLMKITLKAPPLRILMSVWMAFFVFSFLEFSEENARKTSTQFWQFACMAGLGLAVVLLCYFSFSSLTASIQKTKEYRRQYVGLVRFVNGLELKTNHLYILWSYYFPFEWIDPLRPQPEFTSKHFYSLGHNQIPESKARILKKYHVTNLYKGAIGRSDIHYLMDSSAVDRLETMRLFMLEHYHIHARPVVEKQYGKVMKVRWEMDNSHN